jgi:hypothetical protein
MAGDTAYHSQYYHQLVNTRQGGMITHLTSLRHPFKNRSIMSGPRYRECEGGRLGQDEIFRACV